MNLIVYNTVHEEIHQLSLSKLLVAEPNSIECQSGLNHQIRMVVNILSIRRYSDIVTLLLRKVIWMRILLFPSFLV